jgi:ribosomal protein S18 acetylase RimI-like enzyme
VTELVIRPATLADTDSVLGILNEAAEWLTARKIAGWRRDQWKRATLAAAIARKETLLAFERDRAVGTVNLQWTDELFWPGAPADAGYVHRLAVGRDAHGRSVGLNLLAAAERSARDLGKRFVRLDCACESAGLRAY